MSGCRRGHRLPSLRVSEASSRQLRPAPWTRLLLALLLAPAWAISVLAEPATAHTLDTLGYSEIEQRGDDVRYRLLVDYAALAIVSGIGEPGGTPEVAERELSAGADKVAAYLDRHLRVLVDGVACAAHIEDIGIEQRFAQPYASISLTYDCPSAGAYEIRYSVLVGDLDPGHSNAAGYELGGRTGEFVFDDQHRDLVVGDANPLRQAYRFAVLGLHHILGGLDHVLFVIALLIGAAGLREVLGVVTAFTLAHSITLALAALDLVSLPSAVIEPLIALSIAYVAAANVLGRPQPKYQLAAVFAFGLLHGLGFAGALQLTGEFDPAMVMSLLSFNVGIEIGQALVVALLFPLFLFVRRFAWSQYVHLGASVAIALIGLVWFVERIVLA